MEKTKNWYEQSPIGEKMMFAMGMLHTAIEACLNIDEPGDDIASTLIVVERILDEVHEEIMGKKEEPRLRTTK